MLAQVPVQSLAPVAWRLAPCQQLLVGSRTEVDSISRRNRLLRLEHVGFVRVANFVSRALMTVRLLGACLVWERIQKWAAMRRPFLPL